MRLGRQITGVTLAVGLSIGGGIVGAEVGKLVQEGSAPLAQEQAAFKRCFHDVGEAAAGPAIEVEFVMPTTCEKYSQYLYYDLKTGKIAYDKDNNGLPHELNEQRSKELREAEFKLASAGALILGVGFLGVAGKEFFGKKEQAPSQIPIWATNS